MLKKLSKKAVVAIVATLLTLTVSVGFLVCIKGFAEPQF